MTKQLQILMIGLGLGGMGAWLLKPGALTQEKMPESPPGPRVAVLAGNATKPKPAQQAAMREPRLEQLKQKLIALLDSPNEEGRADAIRAELSKITAQDAVTFPSLWREVATIKPEANGYWSALNHRIGQVAGSETVGKRKGDRGRDMDGVRSYVKDQFAGWMETDPKGAEAWLSGLKNAEFQSALLEAYSKEMQQTPKLEKPSKP